MKVYLDIYFILNLIINFFLLGVTGVLRQKRISFRRWFLCSVAGSLFSTVIYACSCMAGRGYLLLDLCSIPVLVRFSYQDKNRRIWFQDTLFLGVMTMLTGGCLYAVYEGFSVWQPALFQAENPPAYMIMGLIIVGILALSVVFLLLGKELLYQTQYGKNVYEAVLYHQGRKYHIQILQDTGNQLVSPYTGERVAVIAKALAGELGLEQEQAGLYIPYHSIGGSGILPAYRLERLEWGNESVHGVSYGRHHGHMEHFLAAVSTELGEQEIQMIVNDL